MKLKNFQFILLLFYSIIVLLVFYFILFEIGISQITDISYIKEKALYYDNLLSEKFFISRVIFFLLSIIYVFCLGIYFPLVVVFGFFFGAVQGTILANLSTSIGSLILYNFAKKFLKDFSYFDKFESTWLKKFRNNEFLLIFIFRLFGGGGIPSNLQNLIPVVFKVRQLNYFFGTFLGQLPAMFVVCNLVHQLKTTTLTSNDKLSYLLLNDKKLLLAFLLYIFLVFLLFIFRSRLKKL